MMKWILVALSILYCGCSQLDIPKSKLIPIKCNIDLPKKPSNQAKNNDDYKGILANQLEILSYTEEIEKDLEFCVKGVKDEDL